MIPNPLRPSPLLTSLTLAIVGLCCARSNAQGVEVSAHIELKRHASSATHLVSSNVVLWLTPLDKPASSAPPQDHPTFTLAQKDKQFTPHLLVVPVGSSVDFPNLDPFFHNVFSLFNGKRFDLGLYEGHTHRSVQFDREGVSFIFCNIHPDMGAVIVSLSTPYYAVSSPDGSVVLRNVPRGHYRLSVWAENVAADRLNALSRTLEIGSHDTALGTLTLETGPDSMPHHTNKFGDPYKPIPKQPY